MVLIQNLLTFVRGYVERRREARVRCERKRSQSRASARRARERRQVATLSQAWAATAGTFIVADLETTGLSAQDEILEFAAVRVSGDGTVLAEFSTLVRIRQSVPALITELTGITQADVRRLGVPLPQALAAFLEFVGAHPVFFHNASFDHRFIQDAVRRHEQSFENRVLCTLKVARALWPELKSHKLAILARHVGVQAPTHRGLDDVKVTLAVLLAGRELAEELTLAEAKLA